MSHFQLLKLVEIEKEYSISENDKSSLAIKVLTILGGFLASLAFLGFLAIAGLYESKVGIVVFGLLFMVAAIFLNLAFDKLIYDTLSVFTYVLGYCLIGTGLSMLEVNANIISILFVFMAVSVLFITQNYIISFISVLIVNGSLIFIILHNQTFEIIHFYNAIVLLLFIQPLLMRLSRSIWLGWFVSYNKNWKNEPLEYNERMDHNRKEQ